MIGLESPLVFSVFLFCNLCASARDLFRFPNQAGDITMRPPRRRLMVRALVAWIVLFAINFGGIAWLVRHRYVGGGSRLGVQLNPLLEVMAPFVVFGPFLLLIILILLYIPQALDEIIAVALILILLILLIAPAMQHS